MDFYQVLKIIPIKPSDLWNESQGITRVVSHRLRALKIFFFFFWPNSFLMPQVKQFANPKVLTFCIVFHWGGLWCLEMAQPYQR